MEFHYGRITKCGHGLRFAFKWRWPMIAFEWRDKGFYFGWFPEEFFKALRDKGMVQPKEPWYRFFWSKQ